MPRLVVTGKEGETLQFPLAEGRTLVGRSRSCQVAIKDSTLSARHAAIERVNGAWCIIDLESTNGVIASGKRVNSLPLTAGATFQLGRFTFQFVEEASDKPAASPAVATGAPAAKGVPKPKTTTQAAPSTGPTKAAKPYVPSYQPPRRHLASSIALSATLVALIGGGFWAWRSSTAQSTGPATGSVSVAPVPAAPPPAPAVAAGAPPPAAAPETPPAPAPALAPAQEDPFEHPVEPVSMQPPMGLGPSSDELALVGLRNGDLIEAKVLDRTGSELVLEIPPQGEGKPTQRRIPIEDVEQINGELVRIDFGALFQVRLSEAGDDAEAMWRVAEWCDRFRLPDERRRVLDRILAVAPNHEATHRALGHVRYQGEWFTPEQLKAKGLVDDRGRFKVDLATRRYLRRVIVDLLGRAPLEEDFAQAMGEGREETVGRLVACRERHAFWYEEELYYFLLLDQHHPASKHLMEIPDRLAAAEAGIWDALHEIVISQYFNARNPGNDTYATVVLEQLMGITVQKQVDILERAKKMYDNYKQVLFKREGSSQADLVQIIMDQEETARFFVKRQYERLVGVPIDKETLERDTKRLRGDQFAWNEIVKGWILSPVYESALGGMKKKSDQVFIRALYVDLLGRLPTYQELRSMRNAMQALADPGPLRNVMAKVMVDSDQVQASVSGDPRAWIGDLYVKYLCREPSEKELAVLGGALSSKRATPKMILHAILSSAEYQYY